MEYTIVVVEMADFPKLSQGLKKPCSIKMIISSCKEDLKQLIDMQTYKQDGGIHGCGSRNVGFPRIKSRVQEPLFYQECIAPGEEVDSGSTTTK